MTRLRSADLYNCRCHSTVIIRGHTNTCVDTCLLCLDFLVSSKHCVATHGGGAHTYWPTPYLGTHLPSTFLVPPLMSWPFQNQSSLLNTVSWVCVSPPCASLNHARIPGLRSRAVLCIGIKDHILSPFITPSTRHPLLKPSVPCFIIRVPAT